MLINFYGQECPHCVNMAVLLEKLKKETGLVIEDREVWHNLENAKFLKTCDTNLCGGVPFLYNTETKNYICGESSYEELKEWAGL